jgi:hypothetical protein
MEAVLYFEYPVGSKCHSMRELQRNYRSVGTHGQEITGRGITRVNRNELVKLRQT